MRILYQLTSPMEKTVLGAAEAARRREFLRTRAGRGVGVDVWSLDDGPPSIESEYEEALVVPELSVLDVARDRDGVLDRMAGIGRAVVRDHGADVLVLGCMSLGFLGVADDVQKRLEIPVVNPVAAALKTAETLVALGLTHSRLAYPTPPKEEPSR